MQFKEVGNKIQVLSYRGYDKDKKRSIVKMIGSIDKYNFSMTDILKNNMTEEEELELQRYIEKLERERQKEADSLTIIYAHNTINRIAALIQKADDFELSKAATDEIWKSIDNLSKSLKKAGFSKPQKPKKLKVIASEKQAGLDLSD